MKITIVTICYNAEKSIGETMDSVVSQTYKDIEYIIVDGASQDKTLLYIQKYQQKYPFMKIVSEPDSGIYAAMNKGIQMATGEYILFLNSGDRFYNETVLEKASRQLRANIVYGDVVREFETEAIHESYRGKWYIFWLLLQGRMMSHQCIFTKTEVMKRYGFDETYRICADYDFVVRAMKHKESFQHINMVVSIVENVMGVSSNQENLDKMREEDDRSLREHFPLEYYLLKPIKSFVRYRKRKQEVVLK